MGSKLDPDGPVSRSVLECVVQQDQEQLPQPKDIAHSGHVLPHLGIEGNALLACQVAEFFRRTGHQGGKIDGSAVDRHRICIGSREKREVFD